jgi:hypothetical protein
MPSLQDDIQEKSNAELLKMAYQLDQWSPEMLSEVEKELTKRNILPADLNARRQQLIDTEEARLIKGQQAGLFGQIIGWATVFGFLGIFIGYHYAFSRRRSKYTGKQYFTYNEPSRKGGTYLFYAAICISLAVLLYKL